MKFSTPIKMIVAVLLAIIIIFAIYSFYNKNNISPVALNTNSIKEYNFPEPNFDGSAKIANTGVTVQYPKNGFYDLGAEINSSKDEPNTLGSVNIAVTAKYDSTKPSEFVILNVGVRNKKETETIKTIADLRNNIQAIAPGRTTLINGKEYFIQESVREATSVTEWYGTTIVNDKVLVALMTFRESDMDVLIPSAESAAAYKNNDKLFLDILGHIKF